MRHKKLIFLLVIIILVSSTGCKMQEARAYEVYQETWRKNEEHRLKMAEEKALLPDKVIAQQNLLIFGQVGLMVLLSGSIITILYLGWGMTRAEVKRRQFTATLIPLDPTTRQYPLLPYAGPSGVLRVYNPNTNSILRLDQGNNVDHRLADNSARVQVAGVLGDGRESKSSLLLD